MTDLVTVDGLLRMVLDGRGRYDGDEAVDDLAHALQTAALARSARADPDVVAAALLHDVGHHPEVEGLFPLVPHELAAARLVEPLLGARAAWIVREHVAAKRHLAATDSGYLAALSPASLASLQRQGGPALLPQFADGWGPLALDLRRWDDLAKVVDAPEQPDLIDLCRAAAAF
ncbi:MAG: HD domain-containing protein [Frankiales bacterium]|nr:HD domain-containing protein [Frankiales bacterium]